MSVYSDLIDWVEDQLVASALVASNSIEVRDRPVWLQTDPDPLIVVSPGSGVESLVGRQTGGVVTLAFPVLVTYITQNSQEYGNPRAKANIRATMREYLFKLKPIDAVRFATFDPMPVIDLVGFPQGFTVVPHLFVYHGNETIPE